MKAPTPIYRGSNNLSFSTESKVKQRGVASDTWLPTGWLIKDRGRSSDARPGLVDKYYVDPSSGRKFRSKKKVLYYLETGTPQPKRKKGTETPVEKVDWLFSSNASADSWTPFLGDDQVQVPESTT
ncbi:hypothetical protein GOBAR_DD33417 [Gossypium barbadense]|nr:hypothetical protein GOBAR_DD33417 [Gossypium barbadense]